MSGDAFDAWLTAGRGCPLGEALVKSQQARGVTAPREMEGIGKVQPFGEPIDCLENVRTVFDAQMLNA